MRSRYLTALVAFLTLSATNDLLCQWNPQMGMYARHPITIWDRLAGSPKPLTIGSPDRGSSINAQYAEPNGNSRVTLSVRGDIGTLQVNLGPGVGSELLWRPDSQGFFVTTSDEGANGAYRLVVVESFDNKLQSRDLTPIIYQAFGHPFRCGSPEAPNVGGVAWTNDHHILVAAEVIHHSNCDSFGTFVLYEVDPANMTIVRKYTQLQAKQLFLPLLGQELLAAPDECIRKPSSCYVSTNHQSAKSGASN
jgi:hypothetical protein